MTVRTLTVAFTGLAFSVCTLSTTWLAAADDISMEGVRLSGLEVQWMGHVQLDVQRDRVVDVELHVHNNQANSFYELRYAGVRETIAFTDVNPRGEILGAKGAKEWAELRKEILEAEGKEVSMELVTVPLITLYAMSGSGAIHAIDAETGRTRWATTVGVALHGSVGIGANDNSVVAVKGSTVYRLDSQTGQLVWSRRIRSAPGGGIALSDTHAFVTTIAGYVQAYPLNDSGIPSEYFISSGRVTKDPTITPNSVSWSTERGYFNVADVNEVQRIKYRLKTGMPILASGASVGDYLVVNSVGGKVFGIIEQEGTIGWEFATGDRLAKPPVRIDNNRAAVISDSDNLFVIDVNTGKIAEGWPQLVKGITSYAGATENLLYFVDTRNQLVALKRDSGNQVTKTPMGPEAVVMANAKTDRLYIGNGRGNLICLREINSLNPLVHGGDVESTDQVNPFDTDQPDMVNPFASPNEQKDAEEAGKAAPVNPFDTKQPPRNPFGGDNKKDDKKDSKKGNNPFGG